jgi:hypothetical protein
VFGTVVEQLESAIDQVAACVSSVEDVDVSRSESLEALLAFERLRERLSASIGCLATDLEARDAHRHESATSMANWVAARTGEARSAVGSRLRLARALRSMPATAEALGAGEITHSHANVLSRALTPRTEEAFARDEATILVPAAKKVTADQLAQIIEFWLRRNDLDGAEPGLEGGPDKFFLSQTLDGRLKGNFDLGGDLAVTVKMVIDEHVAELLRQDKENRKADPTDPGLDQLPSERRARALGELCTRAAASAENPKRRQPLFVLHTTLDTLTETGDPLDWELAMEQAWSSAIPLDQAHLWACDCWLAQVVIRGQDREVLDAGREERVANRAMRRALVARDGSCCAVPGCDRPVGWCDAHHIIWWRNGGLTKVENLIFLCRWHHTRVHSRELVVEMIDGRPRFTNRNGMVLVEPRAGPAPPGDPPRADAA